ncbi:MAG: hypothetical protein OXR62_16150 [Ahrensia sp.]|nr:hypothetical protein [Ahrensia sp.]
MPEAHDINTTSTDEPKTDRPILHIDYALYESHLKESNLSEAEKQAFLESLWDIIVGFVDLGFGVHPLQQACEQELDLSSLMATDVICSKKGYPKTQFAEAADHHADDRAERIKA